MRLTTHLAALVGLAVLAALPLPLAAQDSAPAVTVAEAQMRPLMQVVPVTGSLVALNEVLVFPHAGGFAITELNAEIGDRVAAGDVLARIDARTLTLRVAQAQAQLANARAAHAQSQSQVASTEAQLQQANLVLDRVRALRESGTATQSALDEALTAQLSAAANAQSARDGVQAALAGLEQAQASLEVAQLDLQNASVTAPVGGVVTARNGQIGAIASTGGEPIFRIIEDGIVEVSAEVIETELVLLNPGDPALLQIAGLPPVQGQVRRIAPVVSAVTRLGEVRIAIADSDGLRPGLYVGGRVVVADREGLAVPLGAVLRDTEGSFVYRLAEGDILERRPVEPGLTWDGWQEIITGLAPGDVVLARAGAFFGDGDRVRPVQDGVQDTAPEAATAEGPSE